MKTKFIQTKYNNYNILIRNDLDYKKIINALSDSKYNINEQYGRNNIKILKTNNTKIVIRKYTHGGMFRFILKDNFINPNRFINEFFLYLYCYKVKINTLNVLGIIYTKIGLFYQGYLITEYLNNSINLYKKILTDKINIYPDIIDSILYLHKNNIYHNDLQIKNFMYKDNKIFIIDFDKSIIKNKLTKNLKLKNLYRFIRSLRKNNLYNEKFYKLLIDYYEQN